MVVAAKCPTPRGCSDGAVCTEAVGAEAATAIVAAALKPTKAVVETPKAEDSIETTTTAAVVGEPAVGPGLHAAVLDAIRALAVVAGALVSPTALKSPISPVILAKVLDVASDLTSLARLDGSVKVATPTATVTESLGALRDDEESVAPNTLGGQGHRV